MKNSITLQDFISKVQDAFNKLKDLEKNSKARLKRHQLAHDVIKSATKQANFFVNSPSEERYAMLLDALEKVQNHADK